MKRKPVHMSRRLAAAGVLAAAVVAAASCGKSDRAPGAGGGVRPALSGRLVYQRGEGRESEIWVTNLASGASIRLTENHVLDEYPRWSPDGSEIAFYSDRDGTRQLYIMGADGRNPRRLTGAFPLNEDPSWSPDGKRLCFWARPAGKGREDIYLIHRDGTGTTNLTHAKKGNRRVPAWSPDGRMIAFTSDMFLGHQIYVIDADGTREKRLTANPRGACRARWSPDGRRIAYSDGGYAARQNVDIWEMDPDGENKKRLTEDRGKDYDPAYSPDGTKIIFASNRSGRYELYVMNRDGSNEVQLSRYGDCTRYPDWAR